MIRSSVQIRPLAPLVVNGLGASSGGCLSKRCSFDWQGRELVLSFDNLNGLITGDIPEDLGLSGGGPENAEGADTAGLPQADGLSERIGAKAAS